MESSRDKERYRLEQEAFVSNHGGTTSQEVVHVILPNVCGVLLTITTLGLYGKYLHRNVKIVIEFVLTVVPCILCCTILSEYVSNVCVLMIVLSFINIMLMRIKVHALTSCILRPIRGKRPFVTNFRALSNIITVICILAVDFRIFPRKFAKTEVFGYSLMDTGVGIFVLANALVAPEARDFGSQPKEGFFGTLSRNLKTPLKSSIPLLLLGFGRFLAIEFLGYQRHTTEYGVHWNFFITLAFVKLFTRTITSTISSRYSLLSGIWILAMHEYILTNNGLKEWILSNEPRINFITANREGLMSIPGYVGLYLVGVAVGRLIHSTYLNLNSGITLHPRKNIHIKIFGYDLDASYNESMILCVKLSLIAAQACAATLFCDKYFGVSRRLANAGYCAWILTLSTMMLTLLLLIEVVTDILIYATSDYKSIDNKNDKVTEKMGEVKHKRHKAGFKTRRENKHDMKQDSLQDLPVDSPIKRTLEIFEAVNYNGLVFFLSCNMLTGLINLLISTLYAGKTVALQIIIAYTAVNILFILILYRWQVQLKL
ncbi:GPI-anchored wall transfer protein 1-like [Vespa crabro]|uniref:GPI-anchored wall transfer protein 1-like n=1 Tax=Vespa crabro TaxID=7445 RepID=UPI001F00299D|nr:GPI-anchored wall transfer protein 1-like [Vespa crabro]